MEVKYEQGMTKVWSDGEKITVVNDAGTVHVEANIDNIFGVGEWNKIHAAIYFQVDNLKDKRNGIRKFECISGYIPQRVVDDLEEQLPEDVVRENALEAIKNV